VRLPSPSHAPAAFLVVAQTIVLIVGGIDFSQAADVQVMTIALVAWTGSPDAGLVTVLPVVLGLGGGVRPPTARCRWTVGRRRSSPRSRQG